MHFAWTATGLCYRLIPNVTAEDVSVYSIRRPIETKNAAYTVQLSIQHSIHTYRLQLRTIDCVGSCISRSTAKRLRQKNISFGRWYLSRFERQIAKIRQRKQLTVCPEYWALKLFKRKRKCAKDIDKEASQPQLFSWKVFLTTEIPRDQVVIDSDDWCSDRFSEL